MDGWMDEKSVTLQAYKHLFADLKIVDRAVMRGEPEEPREQSNPEQRQQVSDKPKRKITSTRDTKYRDLICY